jgi:hypothetical protein
MKMCRFVSDNTPTSEPNILTMVQRDDGDIEFCVSVHHSQERGISVRASGSRLKNYAKVINLFSQVIDILNEEECWEEINMDYFDEISEKMVAKGYRKQNEVAKNIFEDVRNILLGHCNGNYTMDVALSQIRSLQDKYTKEEKEK